MLLFLFHGTGRQYYSPRRTVLPGWFLRLTGHKLSLSPKERACTCTGIGKKEVKGLLERSLLASEVLHPSFQRSSPKEWKVTVQERI